MHESEQSESAYCPVCHFRLFLPVARMSASTLGLYDDKRFPGRCLLALDEHFEHLDDVPSSLMAAFLEDARRVGRALRTSLIAERVNYAVLGNTEPHVHMHIIPRVRVGDPVPARPPWEHPLKAAPLQPTERTRLMNILRDAVSRTPSA